MKRYVFALLGLCTFITSFAQNWTSETVKAFRKSSSVSVVMDFSKSIIMDVSYEDFPAYYAGKFSSNETYANLILTKFSNRFITNLSKVARKDFVKQEEAEYVIVYQFRSITEKGGFDGTFYVLQGNNKSNCIRFSRKDGRWNSFEELLLENADKYWNSIKDIYTGATEQNPYKAQLKSKKDE